MSEKLSVNEFAASIWENLPITQKTRSNYKGVYKRHLARHIGEKTLQEVSRRELLDAFAVLPPHTYYQTLMSCRVIFREALNRELVEVNPAAAIKSPKLTNKPQKFLTWEMVKETDFGKYDTQIKFLALHGLRWGEAVALLESDIYDEKVHINKSMYGPTKTPSGVREVPYFGYFKQFPKSRVAIARELANYEVTIHSLRKTYAYFLKTNDVHVTTAAKFLGHSDPMVTLKIYTMVRDNEIDDIGAKLKLVLHS